MSDRTFTIDPDIRRAWTLPSWVYTDPETFAVQRERIFATSWQLVADTDRVKVPRQVSPVTFLEGMVEEPLVLTRDQDDRLHCLSNVCTHRGNVVCAAPAVEPFLRCRYHGRRFALDGRFLSMPEFDDAADFPTAADNLPALSVGLLGKLVFAALDPMTPLDRWLEPVRSRCGWMPLGEATLDPQRSRDYLVNANWALYCDNYLEGFHIPYVHHGLAEQLDYAAYRTELFEWSSVQIGVAKPGEDSFDLPRSSPEHGQRVAGYYFWLFPNLMLNFYPWGISVNIVKPLALTRTRVSFLAYVWDHARLDRGAGTSLDRVEREDEAIVECVQTGVGSRLYARGRYSPTREQGVHHFHRLLAAALSDATHVGPTA
jgi:choline monooxygenase